MTPTITPTMKQTIPQTITQIMQTLLDACSEYAVTWCIKYNHKKTKVMYFGKNHDSFTCAPLTLNHESLEFVKEYKYLGVLIKSENGFFCSCKKPRTAFYRSSNSILNVIKKPSENVLMRLLYSICVPNLTYACEVINYHYKEKESLHVALNDAIRRIFSYHRWQSIKSLRECFGYLSVREIFARAKAKFESQLSTIGNKTLIAIRNS